MGCLMMLLWKSTPGWSFFWSVLFSFFCVATTPASAANTYDQITGNLIKVAGGDWWVVLGSEPNPNNGDTFDANSRVNNMLAPCRFEAFTDWSAKWSGFRPGLSVSVIGPYQSEGDALNVRDAASACIPDAYVKRGVYSGE